MKSLVVPNSRSRLAWLVLVLCVFAYALVFVILGPVYGPSFIVLSVVPVVAASAFFGMRASIAVTLISIAATLILAALESTTFVYMILSLNWPVFVITAIIGVIVGHFHDLQKAREGELAERRRVERRLKTLTEMSQAIVRGRTPEAIGQGIVAQLCDVLACDCATLLVYESGNAQTARVLAAYNRKVGFLGQDGSAPLATGVVVAVAPDRALGCPLHNDDDTAACQSHCGLTLRSYMSEPLAVSGRVVGALALGAETPDRFGREQTDIVREIAAQLAIAIDNARLREEQQRYVEELEALRVATLQLTSRLDREHVLGTILKYALRLMRTDNAHIFLYDGEQLLFGVAFWHGELRQTPLYEPREDGLTMRVARGKERLVIPDMSGHPLYETDRYHGAIVGMPLMVSEQVVGVMSVAFEHPHSITDHDLQLLDLFADHAALAIYNTRLVERIQDQKDDLEDRVAERTAALLDANESLEAILQNSTDAIFLVSRETRQLVRMNATAREWFGVQEREEAPNLHVNWDHFLQGDTRTLARKTFDRVLETGEPQRIEMALTLGDNSLRHVDVAVTLDGPRESARQVVCSLRDITDRKSAEENRALLVDGLRAVVSAAYALLDCPTLDDLHRQAVETARDGLGLDRCALFVPTDENFYGTYGVNRHGELVDERENRFSISDPFWVDRLDTLRGNDAQWITVIQPLIEWQGDRNVEIGTTSWVAITPLRTPKGLVGVFFNDAGLTGKALNPTRQELVYLFASLLAHIITRKQLEDNLQQALHRERELNDLKSRFVSMVSHEFRTPLSVIQSSGDMLKYYNDRMSAHARKDRLETIQEQIRHLTGLLDDVLAISRAESVGLEYNPIPLDLVALCHAIISEFESAIRQRQLVLKLKGLPRPVMLDPKLMRQAISNLLSNAMKYSPDDSPVDVTLAYEPTQVILSVTDYGIGIPEDDRARIFEVFHRARNVDHVSGTGLGLAIVKHVADLHDGEVDCDSQPGSYTTFRLRLPAPR